MVISFSGLPILGPHAAQNLRGEMSCFPRNWIIKERQVALDSPYPVQPLKVVNVYCKTSTLAGSLRNFRYASTMDFLGCPASHLLGLVAGWKPWMQGISTRNLKWKKISGAETKTYYWNMPPFFHGVYIFIVYLPWKIISGMLPLITWTSPKALFLWRRLQWSFSTKKNRVGGQDQWLVIVLFWSRSNISFHGSILEL